MRPCEAPASWAAITKSSSRSERNLPRTTRAMPVQLMMDRMTVMAKYTRMTDQSLGIVAAKPIHSGIVGMEVRTSIMR